MAKRAVKRWPEYIKQKRCVQFARSVSATQALKVNNQIFRAPERTLTNVPLSSIFTSLDA